jgi:hypothetical protein
MKFLLAVLFILSASSGFAQSNPDLSRSFAMNAVSPSASLPIHEDYLSPRGYRDNRGGKKSFLYWTAFTICYTGGALIGIPVGTAIGGGTPNWALAGVGAGLVGIGIWLEVVDNKRNYALLSNDKTAADLYASSRRVRLNLAASANSIGLQLQF